MESSRPVFPQPSPFPRPARPRVCWDEGPPSKACSGRKGRGAGVRQEGRPTRSLSQRITSDQIARWRGPDPLFCRGPSPQLYYSPKTTVCSDECICCCPYLDQALSRSHQNLSRTVSRARVAPHYASATLPDIVTSRYDRIILSSARPHHVGCVISITRAR